MTRSAIPQRRQNSIVRTFTSFILGVLIRPSVCSTRTHLIPRQPRSAASASPTGPPPAISTGVSRTEFILTLYLRYQSVQEKEAHMCASLEIVPMPGRLDPVKPPLKQGGHVKRVRVLAAPEAEIPRSHAVGRSDRL